jgi:hypothetical protein
VVRPYSGYCAAVSQPQSKPVFQHDITIILRLISRVLFVYSLILCHIFNCIVVHELLCQLHCTCV